MRHKKILRLAVLVGLTLVVLSGGCVARDGSDSETAGRERLQLASEYLLAVRLTDSMLLQETVSESAFSAHEDAILTKEEAALQDSPAVSTSGYDFEWEGETLVTRYSATSGSPQSDGIIRVWFAEGAATSAEVVATIDDGDRLVLGFQEVGDDRSVDSVDGVDAVSFFLAYGD